MNRRPYKELIHQHIDWERIDHRLNNYAAIARAFPKEEVLSRYANEPPYFCHYMAWRLGGWQDDSLFERLNGLLLNAEQLPNWREESGSLISSNDFSEFWSLIWQLQVAELFRNCYSEKEVSWVGGKGPDLLIRHRDGSNLHVECYVYRKSFGLKTFIADVLARVDPNIKVDYNWCLPFSLPNNEGREKYLASVLGKFTDKSFIDEARREAASNYPFIMHERDDRGIVVYMEGDNPENYSAVKTTGTGDPDEYLANALVEVVNAKQGRNGLDECRPHIVMANLLLSSDFLLALNRCLQRQSAVPWPDLGKIDNIAIGAVGIDEALSPDNLLFARGNPICG